VRKLLVLIAAFGLMASACASDGSTATTRSRSTSSTTAPAVDPASVPAAPSAGCRSDAVVPPGETKQTVTASGAERYWYRHVPPATTTRPMPLVLDLHGYSEGATIHTMMTKLGPFGDQKGFATVTPQGQGKVARWNTELGSKDLLFLGTVLDTTEQQLCIDTNRVYAAGLSNGAFMTSAVACEFNRRIAAVAPVAGARSIKGCRFRRPVPVVAFHGTADGFVSYDGGLGEKALDLPAPDGSGKTLRETITPAQIKAALKSKSSIPTIMAAWAKRNGCRAGHAESTVAPDVTRLTYDCAPADATVLYRITGGGHAWPGSALSVGIESIVGHTTMNIDANEIMWQFFLDHPLPPT
jgi:polyhydroxybutyrate depolymerase